MEHTLDAPQTRTAPEATDRVRATTKAEVNRKFDLTLERNIRFYAAQDREAISERIRELEREWDTERTLEANAASITLATVILGITINRKWFIMPLIVGGFLLQHAIQGWCPPLPLFRRMGIRTCKEIEQERYALKFLRGDFDNLERLPDGSLKRDAARLVEDLRRRETV